jgi:plastocyanin
MAKTSRRNVLAVAAGGGVAAALGLAIKPESARAKETEHDEHEHKPISGPLANATINFGAWRMPLDRFAAVSPPNPVNTPNDPNPITGNHHALTPHEVTIKAGGTVSFIISGFHQVIVYASGTKPGDINADAQNPFFPLLIDDPTHRIFRGVNPQTVAQDRAESVHFAEQGRYLVICGVRPHFVNDNMFGFVKVVGDDED